jgi:threonine/homoserine/homoserine lactone efflux protein
MEYLLKGILIGLSVAIPVGPIGILTIKRSLTDGRIAGLATGMGAAAADTLYGAMAAFGMTAVSQFLLSAEFLLKLIGGLFLLYLGMKCFFSKPPEESGASSNGVFYNFASTFALTVLSPATIFAFLAVFAAAGLGTERTDFASAWFIVTGVFVGSASWWLFLSWFVSRFRSSMGAAAWTWLNRVSGILIGGFGLYTLLQAILLLMEH